jgi:hypothetical protein
VACRLAYYISTSSGIGSYKDPRLGGTEKQWWEREGAREQLRGDGSVEGDRGSCFGGKEKEEHGTGGCQCNNDNDEYDEEHTDCLEYPGEEFKGVCLFFLRLSQMLIRACTILGDEHQHKWSTVHCTGCREANGEVRE